MDYSTQLVWQGRCSMPINIISILSVLLFLGAIPILIAKQVINTESQLPHPRRWVRTVSLMYVIISVSLLLASFLTILLVRQESGVLQSLLWGTALGSPLIGGLLWLLVRGIRTTGPRQQ